MSAELTSIPGGKPKISLIAAVSRNGVIGRDQQLPWNIPEDLQYFRKTTMGAPIIMGRKTFQSIGRLLPGRKNVIITRQTSLEIPKAVLVSSLEAALAAAMEPEVGKEPPKEIFIIGGGEIYSQALALADRLYITEVDQTIQGDAWFPKWPELRSKAVSVGDRILRFKEVRNDERPASPEEKRPSYRFLILDRA